MPLFLFSVTSEKFEAVRIHTPLELIGRNIYISEGCHQCHSQMIRTVRHEVDRHGRYSLAIESQYDTPTQWGLRRIGGDLARVGNRHSDDWLLSYLESPFAFGNRGGWVFSMMPSYSHLLDRFIDVDNVSGHLGSAQFYDSLQILHGGDDLLAQAGNVEGQYNLLARYGGGVKLHDFLADGKVSEMEALVAYLQSVGALSNLGN